jgi:hypothetical protein
MGGKIPRQIKEKVIRQWLQGTRRSTIAKDNGIGGHYYVSIKEEYYDMELFRH